MKRMVTHRRLKGAALLKSSRLFLISLFLMMGAVCSVSCKKGKAQEQPNPAQIAVPVTSAAVIEKDVPIELRAIGTVEASSSVSIKSLVSGYLQKAHFLDGQDVSAGDRLFTIDPRPFEASLRQAKANLARDVAQLENAKKVLERDEILIQKALESQELYDQDKATMEALAAVVDADRASVRIAQLNLGYCRINSPITGRAGAVLIQEGNLIKANDLPMVIINQVQPINVTFTVPAQYFTEIKNRMGGNKLAVETTIPRTNEPAESGVLWFIDNAIDPKTGTITLKGTFENKNKNLWPGQFVDVKLILGMTPKALVVPSQAIMTGQNRRFVYVIKNDMAVEIRDVTPGNEINGETVIEKGLNAGEQIVTDGQLRLVEGSKVSIKNASAGN